MKFNHLQAFNKHLQSAAPSQLSQVYLLVDPEVYTQKKLAQKICQKDEEWICESAESLSPQKLDSLLNTHSMFSEKTCLCLLGIHKLSKSLLKMLLDALKAPRADMRLILTAPSMSKDFLTLTKIGVALDLSSEKPWDREKRMSQNIMHQFHHHQLRASSSICDQIVRLCGAQQALMDQEVEKLALYLHGQKEVSRKDLGFVLASPQQSIFKVVQALLDGHLKEALSLVHAQKFPLIMLIYSLRSTIQRSYRLQGISDGQYAQKAPEIKGYLLEKSLKLAQQYRRNQFKKMLQVLFQIELLMKSQSLDELFLTSLLLMQLKECLK